MFFYYPSFDARIPVSPDLQQSLSLLSDQAQGEAALDSSGGAAAEQRARADKLAKYATTFDTKLQCNNELSAWFVVDFLAQKDISQGSVWRVHQREVGAGAKGLRRSRKATLKDH